MSRYKKFRQPFNTNSGNKVNTLNVLSEEFQLRSERRGGEVVQGYDDEDFARSRPEWRVNPKNFSLWRRTVKVVEVLERIWR